MTAVHKFPLKGERGEQAVTMPRGATVLSLEVRAAELVLYAQVDTERVGEERVFLLAETGDDVSVPRDKRQAYVGTAVFEWSPYVLHVFERKAY
jgi:hypothetical protein